MVPYQVLGHIAVILDSTRCEIQILRHNQAIITKLTWAITITVARDYSRPPVTAKAVKPGMIIGFKISLWGPHSLTSTCFVTSLLEEKIEPRTRSRS